MLRYGGAVLRYYRAEEGRVGVVEKRETFVGRLGLDRGRKKGVSVSRGEENTGKGGIT